MRYALALLLIASVCQAQEGTFDAIGEPWAPGAEGKYLTPTQWAGELLNGRSEQTRERAGGALYSIAMNRADSISKEEKASLRAALLKVIESSKEIAGRIMATRALGPFVDDSCRPLLLELARVPPERGTLQVPFREELFKTLTPIADDKTVMLARIICLDKQDGSNPAFALIVATKSPAATRELELIATDMFWKEAALEELEKRGK